MHAEKRNALDESMMVRTKEGTLRPQCAETLQRYDARRTKVSVTRNGRQVFRGSYSALSRVVDTIAHRDNVYTAFTSVPFVYVAPVLEYIEKK